ncbi:MAG: D-aminoacyl-tRNA deacylase [Puniceicoccaceae bacterium]
MRAVIQRVNWGEVRVANKVAGAIGKGLLVFLGIEKSDTEKDMLWLANKIPVIRCFEDDEGKMNRSLIDLDLELMVISQFTLFGSLRKGTRPSFNRAAEPAMAIPIYEQFVATLEQITGRPVATGIFGAEMLIQAHNDGPVTLVLDTHDKDF